MVRRSGHGMSDWPRLRVHADEVKIGKGLCGQNVRRTTMTRGEGDRFASGLDLARFAGFCIVPFCEERLFRNLSMFVIQIL